MASSAAALVVPRPQRCPAVASLKQLWRKRRRQHRAAGGLVAPCDSVDASLRRARLAAPLAVARKLQSSGHGAGTQPFVPGAMRFIYEACEQFKNYPVAGYALRNIG